MHQEVKDYIGKIKQEHPDYFKNKRVLELGSLNFNGSVRGFFEGCDYTGVDRSQGNDVDVVMPAHEYDSEPFDVVITTEMLEHDKYARQSLLNAYRLLKDGGILIGTAANVNREKHYEFTGEENHYENISKEFVESLPFFCEVEEDDGKKDIRFLCKKLEKKVKM